MSLAGILTILDKSADFGKLLERVGARGAPARLAILEAAKPFVIAALHRRLGVPIMIVTARAERAKAIYDQLHAWVDDPDAVMLFPEPDALPYERVGWDSSTIKERLDVLARLWERERQIGAEGRGAPPVIVAGAQAVMQKTISRREFDAHSYVVKRGESINLHRLMSSWIAMGFTATTTVEAPGSFSRRGGIVDIFPPAAGMPVRLDLFGEEVESIRLFDPVTQRSMQLVDSVAITPSREVLGNVLGGGKTATGRPFDPEDPSTLLDLSGLQPEMRDLFTRELAQLAGGEAIDEAEYYAGLTNRATIFDHLPGDALLIVDEPEEVQQAVIELGEQSAKLREAQIERGDLPADFPDSHHDWSAIEKAMAARKRRLDLAFSDAPPSEAQPDELILPFSPVPPYAGRLKVLVDDVGKLLADRGRVVVTSQQSRRLAEILNERDFHTQPVEAVGQLPPAGSLTLVHGTVAEGWRFDDGGGLPLTLFSDAEIFGVAKPRRVVRRRSVNRQAFLADLSVGDYVVHIEHGIGHFSGLTKMAVDGVEREYLVLDYAEGDRLYVPMDQLDRVNRYIGVSEHGPALTRLGTQEWARAKERVKKSVQHIAEDLLAVYSKREVVQGFAFSPDAVWQQEMEASFPYIETPDQLDAIHEVKTDMQEPKPMDRLICGDVGYGKTEVALRAAFKAVMDGKQVAVLVPTTVLAQQHFETFKERMGAFPVGIEVLSRFRSDKEQRAVIAALREGKVDICIGTHRLLQKDVSFKDLGLLIIDEEQRFGVVHKEMLKRMRTEVDVLTMTATPIPRTLHMALAGVRDMSTIETPPEERLPIKTYVTGYDDGLIRQAIIREMDRGGQVFFVHNRVENIAHIANHLMDLVPEASFSVGHGQMHEDGLERVMLDFAAGKTDVLICTTIIESGLDMPNVNTLIVNQADHFGLAQLYQLRGRVGRGANRAYAYFLYNKNKRLTEQAQKRLRTIFEATELGSGFRIAMKDLEIRGAGNLLGVEQSGHMSAVGFDLYCRLLSQAVVELKAKRAGEAGETVKPLIVEMPSFPSVDLPLDAYIAEHYVADYATRLSLYQRMAHIAELGDVEEMAQEMWDRFGEYPEPVRNLIYVLTVKLLAAKAGAQSVIEEGGQLIVKFGSTITADRRKLQQIGGPALKIGNAQLRLDRPRLGNRWKQTLQAVLEFMATSAHPQTTTGQVAKVG